MYKKIYVNRAVKQFIAILLLSLTNQNLFSAAKISSGLNDLDAALHEAINQDNKEKVELLIAAKADVNPEQEDHCPLRTAIKKSNEDIIELLIKAKANVNPDYDGRLRDTPLTLAASRSTKKIVKLLMDANANVNVPNGPGDTPLMSACRNPEIMKLLIDSKADVNATARMWGRPVISRAIDTKNKEAVKLLIDSGSDINQPCRYLQTPLIWAVRSGQSEMAQLLCDSGANIDAVECHGQTALMVAVEYDNIDLVKLLLHSGVDTNLEKRLIKYDGPSITYGTEKPRTYHNKTKILELINCEPERRIAFINKYQACIIEKIMKSILALNKDVASLISEYTLGTYQEALQFEKSNKDIISLFLAANESSNTLANGLKRKANDSVENTDKKARLSAEAIAAYIAQLKEKKEKLIKEINQIINGSAPNKADLVIKLEEELKELDDQIETLES